MNVLKFGGTSVGSVQNMKIVKNIICDGERKIVVLSAMSGTTNDLIAISNTIKSSHQDKSYFLIEQLYTKYKNVIKDLLQNKNIVEEAEKFVLSVFEELHSLETQHDNPLLERIIVSKGEILSTHIFSYYLKECNVNSKLISALDFMRKDANDEPDNFYIEQNIKRILQENENIEIFITQGFISLDKNGTIDNLNRGGSDYTASIIGAAIDAENIQIWTDIDGFHNNDPRVVTNTKSIEQLSFDEAAELAYFGAKILHPMTILPAQRKNIPVWLKNTMQPNALGTIISNEYKINGIKAIAAKDNITAINIKSARMFLAHGFLKKVFDVFETYETSIDMITTSEVAVSLTIDDTKNLTEIENKIAQFSDITIEKNQSIICIVGHNIIQDPIAKEIFKVLTDFPIRMISYGGSKNNITLLVADEHKKEIMQTLNKYLFS